MKAGVWEGIGRIACRDVDPPSPKPGEVLVDVAFCGLCGTDPHIIEGHFPVGDPPQVIGHEVSGIVAEVAEGVRGFAPGDRVACNLYAYCGACPWCRAGQPNHCRRKFFAAKGFAEQAVYRPEQLFHLPPEVSLEVGAFLEPVATCLHAVEVGEVRAGEHVLVIGGGPLGQIVAQMARLHGAATVTVSELRARNRSLAVELGATRAVDPAAEDVRDVARATGDRRGFDVVFEVAGSTAALEAAPELLSPRGRLVVVGVFPVDVAVPIRPFLVYERELSIRGANAADRDFARAVDLLPHLRLEPLITAVEPLEEIATVYERHQAGAYVKVLVQP